MISLFVMLEDAISIMGSSRTKPKYYAYKGEKVEMLNYVHLGISTVKHTVSGEHFPVRTTKLEPFNDEAKKLIQQS